MKCRKRIRRCRNRGVTLPPGSARGNAEACPSGIRHVGEAQPGSCTERENLDGDAKGKGTSGSNREAESTDAPVRGGLLRSSKEAGVMPVERRGQVTDVGSEPTGNRRSSNSRRKAAAFVRWHEPDDARVSSPDLWEARGESPGLLGKTEKSSLRANVLRSSPNSRRRRAVRALPTRARSG